VREVAIREAQSRDRATEAVVIGALKIEAWLHNGAWKGRADPLALSTQGANWHGAVTGSPVPLTWMEPSTEPSA
jgi:hypothetical protein